MIRSGDLDSLPAFTNPEQCDLGCRQDADALQMSKVQVQRLRTLVGKEGIAAVIRNLSKRLAAEKRKEQKKPAPDSERVKATHQHYSVQSRERKAIDSTSYMLLVTIKCLMVCFARSICMISLCGLAASLP